MFSTLSEKIVRELISELSTEIVQIEKIKQLFIDLCMSNSHHNQIKFIDCKFKLDLSGEDIKKMLKNTLTCGHTRILSLLLDSYSVDWSKIDFDHVFDIVTGKSIKITDDIIELLLLHEKISAFSYTHAIYYACERGNVKVIELLLKHDKFNPDVDNNYAIRFSTKNGHANIVKLLLECPKVNPSVDQNYALTAASENNHPAIVQMLLESKKVDPTTKSNTAIRFAAHHGNTQIVKLLLENDKVDLTVVNNYPIRNACLNGRTDVVDLLLKSGKVNPSVNDNVAIKDAVRYGHTQIVKMLCECPSVNSTLSADVSMKDQVKIAIDKGYFEIANLLLQHHNIGEFDDPMFLFFKKYYQQKKNISYETKIISYMKSIGLIHIETKKDNIYSTYVHMADGQYHPDSKIKKWISKYNIVEINLKDSNNIIFSRKYSHTDMDSS